MGMKAILFAAMAISVFSYAGNVDAEDELETVTPKWTVETDSDAFSDEVSRQAMAPTLHGGVYRYANLSVKCDDGVSSWVNLGYFNNIGSDYGVKVRFDNDAPLLVGINKWRGTSGFSFDSDSFGFLSDLSFEGFIGLLRTKSRLRILLHYYNEGQVVLDFSLAGADAAIGQIMQACPNPRSAEPQAREALARKVQARIAFCEANKNRNLPSCSRLGY